MKERKRRKWKKTWRKKKTWKNVENEKEKNNVESSMLPWKKGRENEKGNFNFHHQQPSPSPNPTAFKTCMPVEATQSQCPMTEGGYERPRWGQNPGLIGHERPRLGG